ELVAYGGTTWDARPEALNQLSKYVKDKPATLDIIVDLLKDNSRSIRSNAIQVIGKHGNKKHIGFLDEVFAEDPILSRQVRAAKKNILEGKRKSKKIDTDTDYKILNKKIKDIRKIIE
ncbi:MAG: HEAT repeat domain-containing protein, partial [Fidelibacterota bacterium]